MRSSQTDAQRIGMCYPSPWHSAASSSRTVVLSATVTDKKIQHESRPHVGPLAGPEGASEPVLPSQVKAQADNDGTALTLARDSVPVCIHIFNIRTDQCPETNARFSAALYRHDSDVATIDLTGCDFPHLDRPEPLEAVNPGPARVRLHNVSNSHDLPKGSRRQNQLVLT